MAFHPPDHPMCSHPSRPSHGPSNSPTLSYFSNSTHLLEGVCHMGLVNMIALQAQPHNMCFSCFEFHPSFSLAAPHALANLLLTSTCRFHFGLLVLTLTMTGVLLPQPNKDRVAQRSQVLFKATQQVGSQSFLISSLCSQLTLHSNIYCTVSSQLTPFLLCPVSSPPPQTLSLQQPCPYASTILYIFIKFREHKDISLSESALI